MTRIFPATPDYTLIRSRKRRKTIALQIQGGGNVIIRAPWSTPKKEIDQFFAAKKQWIAKKLAPREKHHVNIPGSGNELLYLGTSYPLEVLSCNGGPESISFSGYRFSLRCDEALRGKSLIRAWYRESATTHFEKRIVHYTEMIRQFPAGFRLSDARHRWGSCSPRNRLSLNWRLVMAPPFVVDYVVVHELMHIVEKNHSSRFWAHVAKTIPDYRDWRLWLKENAFLLSF